MQQTFCVKTNISKEGNLYLKDLPFQPGELVEVTIRSQKQKKTAKKYPLRGKPVIYREPFKGVTKDDVAPRVPGIDKGKIIINADFDDSLEAFDK